MKQAQAAIERARAEAEKQGFERGIGNVCTAAGIPFPDGVPGGQEASWVVERARAEARLEEAEYWHFQEWNEAAHNGKTCEEIATDWRGYVHALYEGCMRITKLRAALDGQRKGEK